MQWFVSVQKQNTVETFTLSLEMNMMAQGKKKSWKGVEKQ